MLLAAEDNVELMEKELESGEPEKKVTEANKDGQTALNIAALHDRPKNVELLLSNPEYLPEAQVMAADCRGFIPLVHALGANSLEIAELLLEHVPEKQFMARNQNGRTPWEEAERWYDLHEANHFRRLEAKHVAPQQLAATYSGGKCGYCGHITGLPYPGCNWRIDTCKERPQNQAAEAVEAAPHLQKELVPNEQLAATDEHSETVAPVTAWDTSKKERVKALPAVISSTLQPCKRTDAAGARRRYRCGYCGQRTGHNQRTCKLRLQDQAADS